MSEINENKNIPVITTDSESQNSAGQPKLTIEYLLNCIESLRADTAFFENAIKEISAVRSAGPGDVGAAARANALGDAIKAHETTNQRLISLYETMYNDLIGKKTAKETVADIVKQAIAEGSDLEQVESLIETIRFI